MGAVGSPLFSSNRTFMELKWKFVFAGAVAERRSNRTFMELKWANVKKLEFELVGSNRTFMELK